MNKPKVKKLLTFLVCLTLIASVCLLAACNKDTPTEEEETITRTPSFTNGNFESYEDASETAYPYTPDNFTGSPTSDVVINDDTSVDLDNIVKGIINLADYDSYKASWDNLDVFSKNEITDENDKVNYGDDNVLMIYNKEAGYYLYRSDSITISANTTYKITVDVLTSSLDGGANKGATLKMTGASSLVASEGYATFESINTNGNWETYTFYVIGKASGTASLDLQLMLGNNNQSLDYLTKGYAFFDNIRMTTVDNVTDGSKVKVINLKTPNAQFDFSTSSNVPYLYTKNSTDSNANYSAINLLDGTSDLTFGTATLTNPGYATNDNDKHNAYVINNVEEAYMGFYTTSTNYFERGGKYVIKLAVNSEFVESGNAYFAVGTSTSASDCTIIDISAAPGWKEYSIYVYVNENTSSNLYIHFGLGKDSSNKAKGYAFFDVLSIETTDDTTATGSNVLDERLDSSANLIKGMDWTEYDIDSASGITSNATKDVLASDITLPYVSDAFSGNFKVSASEATLYKLGLVYDALSSNSYYRFSVWVKTIDVPSGSGVILTIYDGDLNVNADAEAIETYSIVATAEDLADSTSSLNGYRELVCYFHTAKISQAVTFTLNFGKGTQWTSSTLFKGDAYIVNASLVATEYSKYNSASSSGTYEKKYDWNTSLSTSFTNGQFNDYDYSATKGINNGGMVESEFQKTEFGVPDDWTLKGDKSYVTAGIVDINNDTLLTNLGMSASDINVLEYTSALDIAKYGTYIGGDKVLMIKAEDATGLVEKTVKAGYASSSVTLSANTTYKISVLVKVVSGTASVYLTADNNLAETNDKSKFEITDTSICTETNGWKRYTFKVSVGFSSVSAKLNLYLGATDNDVTLDDSNMTADDNGGYVKVEENYVTYSASNTAHETLQRYKYAGTATGGLVFFDYVTMTTVDDDATAVSDSDYEEVNELDMKVDGFGLSSTYEAGTYQTASGWTKTLGSNVDSDNNKYGVLVGGTDSMKAHSGDNCLAINIPNTAGSIYYTMTSAKTFSTDKYYKVSVWAKTIGVTGGKAYIRLSVTSYDTQTIALPADSDWTEYIFFIKTPSADDKFGDNASSLSVKVVLGLGETSTDDESLATGIALFDDVLLEEVTDGTKTAAEQYAEFVESAKSDSKLLAYNYLSLDPEEEVDPEEEPDEDEEDTTNYNWIIFTSVAFGALIVLVVVIYFVKKYLPKHKENKVVDNKKTTKKKEDDYKDLKD